MQFEIFGNACIASAWALHLLLQDPIVPMVDLRIMWNRWYTSTGSPPNGIPADVGPSGTSFFIDNSGMRYRYIPPQGLVIVLVLVHNMIYLYLMNDYLIGQARFEEQSMLQTRRLSNAYSNSLYTNSTTTSIIMKPVVWTPNVWTAVACSTTPLIPEVFTVTVAQLLQLLPTAYFGSWTYVTLTSTNGSSGSAGPGGTDVATATCTFLEPYHDC